MPSPFGDLLRSRTRPEFAVTPAAATWDFTVFRLAGRNREAFACVPCVQLATFLDRLDTGRLDAVVGDFLGAPAAGTVLVSHDQTALSALWDWAVLGASLLPSGHGPAAMLTPALGTRPLPRSSARHGKPAALVAPTGTLAAASVSPAAEPAVASVPRPVGRRRRFRAAVLAVLLPLVAIAAAALAGAFGGGEPSPVAIVTGPPTPSPPAPPTSGMTSPATETTTGSATTVVNPTLPVPTTAVCAGDQGHRDFGPDQPSRRHDGPSRHHDADEQHHDHDDDHPGSAAHVVGRRRDLGGSRLRAATAGGHRLGGLDGAVPQRDGRRCDDLGLAASRCNREHDSGDRRYVGPRGARGRRRLRGRVQLGRRQRHRPDDDLGAERLIRALEGGRAALPLFGRR